MNSTNQLPTLMHLHQVADLLSINPSQLLRLTSPTAVRPILARVSLAAGAIHFDPAEVAKLVGGRVPTKPMLKVATISERYRIHPRTVRRWIKKGELVAYRIGPRAYRVHYEDVLRLLRARMSNHGTAFDISSDR